MYTKALLGAAITAVALAAAITSAPAAEKEIATLARVTGNALVSKGAKYVSGTEGMALSTSERVMSLEDSSAVIQFNDGCRYTMEENEVITIGSRSPCALTKGPSSRFSVLSPPPPADSSAVLAAVPAPSASLAWVTGASVGVVGILGVALDTDSDSTAPPPISQ